MDKTGSFLTVATTVAIAGLLWSGIRLSLSADSDTYSNVELSCKKDTFMQAECKEIMSDKKITGWEHLMFRSIRMNRIDEKNTAIQS